MNAHKQSKYNLSFVASESFADGPFDDVVLLDGLTKLLALRPRHLHTSTYKHREKRSMSNAHATHTYTHTSIHVMRVCIHNIQVSFIMIWGAYLELVWCVLELFGSGGVVVARLQALHTQLHDNTTHPDRRK